MAAHPAKAKQLTLTATQPDVDNLRCLLDEAMAERQRLHGAWVRACGKVHALRYQYRLAKERQRKRQKALAQRAKLLRDH